MRSPRYTDVFDGGWANQHLQQGTGTHALNPGGIKNICIDSSGDDNCPIPPAYTCELRDSGCTVGSSPFYDTAIVGSLTINGGVVSFNTNSGGYSSYCYVCTDGINVCQDSDRAAHGWNFCSGGGAPKFSAATLPSEFSISFDST